MRILDEPGRALVANSTVTLYTVQSIKRNVDLYVAVDGGMSDNLRPMLYGARYEAQIVGRASAAGRTATSWASTASRATSSSATPSSPTRGSGDVVVTPATGAYGFAMANNYNGVPRAPVVFVKDGDARVVVRRETYEDLTGQRRRACLSPSASACSATAPSARPSPSCSRRAPTRSRPSPACGPSSRGVLTRSRGDFEEILGRLATSSSS